MLTLLAFIVTLGLLVTVHEYGHYKVAKLCGVKVLRFSIGMGKPLLRWQRPGNETEFAIAALPLGGYVSMADETQAPVDEADRPRAFNNQPLRNRAAIVLAGPLANLLLAIVFFAAINWWGSQQPVAVVGEPPVPSLAAQAGLQAGDRITAIQPSGQSNRPIASFDELHWAITHSLLNHQDVILQVQREHRQMHLPLPLSQLAANDLERDTFERVGVRMADMPAVIRKANPGGAAAQAGLQVGDTVHSVDGHPIANARQLIDTIVRTGTLPQPEARTQLWQIERDGQPLSLHVTPQPTERDGQIVGFVNAQIGQTASATVRVRYGPLEGLWRGITRTWDMSALTLQMFGRMLIGEASLKNISGPVSIAQYAGQSASMGVEPFLNFLAIVSLSLAVLNLLPLPVLDGGHLMYYLWEAVTGKPVSDAWLEKFQRAGVLVLLMLMSLAVFNDITRLLG